MTYDPELVARLSANIGKKIKEVPPTPSPTSSDQAARTLSNMGFAINSTPEGKLRQLKMEEDEFNDWFIKELEERAKEEGVTIPTDKNSLIRVRQVYKTLLEQDAILNGYSVNFIMELREEHAAYRQYKSR